jgi:hypothetical protein
MTDELIRQRKRLAMGESLVDVPAIENPFSQVKGSDIPRGEMKDGKRKGSDQDHDGDKY